MSLSIHLLFQKRKADRALSTKTHRYVMRLDRAEPNSLRARAQWSSCDGPWCPRLPSCWRMRPVSALLYSIFSRRDEIGRRRASIQLAADRKAQTYCFGKIGTASHGRKWRRRLQIQGNPDIFYRPVKMRTYLPMGCQIWPWSGPLWQYQKRRSHHGYWHFPWESVSWSLCFPVISWAIGLLSGEIHNVVRPNNPFHGWKILIKPKPRATVSLSSVFPPRAFVAQTKGSHLFPFYALFAYEDSATTYTEANFWDIQKSLRFAAARAFFQVCAPDDRRYCLFAPGHHGGRSRTIMQFLLREELGTV